MSQIIACIRTSTDKRDLNNQKLEILEWAHKKEVKVDAFVEITIYSGKNSKQRRIEEILQMLTDTDTLVVTELSRLGRSTTEVIALVNELVARNIRVIIPKQNLDISQHDMTSKIVITLFSLFKEHCEQCNQPLWVANHNHRSCDVSGLSEPFFWPIFPCSTLE